MAQAVQVPVNAVSGNAQSNQMVSMTTSSYQVGLCDMCAGGPGVCCAGLFCHTCLNASARKAMDNSNWCFNFLCVSGPCQARNVIREGYNIEGGCCDDILTGLFCMPCVACQNYNEVAKRGPANKQWGANRSAAEIPWEFGLCSCCSDNAPCGHCLFGAFCPGIAAARARTHFDGSSCCFQLLCMTSCAARSIIREGYNIEGSCCGEDILKPAFCPCLSAIQMLNEVKHRGPVTKALVAVPAQNMAGRT
ncbi:unnamed protein product [Chrysoparadoxa australica]